VTRGEPAVATGRGGITVFQSPTSHQPTTHVNGVVRANGPKYMERLERLLERAACLERARDFHGAITGYTEAISCSPECAHAYYGRGHAHMGATDYAAAIEDFTVAIELDPSRSYFYSSRALANYGAGEMAGAVRDCDAALDVGADLPPESMARIYYTRGMAWRAMGDSKRAAGSLAKAGEFDLDGRHSPVDR